MYHQESVENDYDGVCIHFRHETKNFPFQLAVDIILKTFHKYQYYSQQDYDGNDPRITIDLDYERQQQSYKMNDAVKSFITHFFKAIQNAALFEITHDYEFGFGDFFLQLMRESFL